jgi:hypothetical protein
MKLAVYLYDQAGAQAAVRLLGRLRRRLAFEQVCVVYRALLDPAALQALGDWRAGAARCDWLPYEGAQWEFAAYQLALDHLGPTPGGLLVVNDTAGRNYPFFDDDLARLAQQAALCRDETQPALIGKIEAGPATFSLCQLHFAHWVRSNLFYLNAAGVAALQRTLFEPAVFAAPSYVQGRLVLGLPASAALEQHLARWMSLDPADDGWIVHAGRPHMSDAVLRGKTGSILLEKRLSSRLQAAGGRLLSYEPGGASPWHRLRVRAFFSLRSRLKRLRARLVERHA